MNGAGLPPCPQGMCMCALTSTAKVRKCAEPEVVGAAPVLQPAVAGVGRGSQCLTRVQCVAALRALWKRNRVGPCGPLL